MKLKGILLTSALTAMLGVGVFAGVSNNKGAVPIEKAEAVTYVTIYCTKSFNYLIDDIRIHQWGGSTAGTSWDWDSFTVMTKVFNNENGQPVFKATIPNDREGISFISKQGDAWKQTVDITSGFTNNAGWYFSGWSGDKMSVGTWTAHPYTINYHGNGSTSGSMSSTSAYADVAWGLTSNAFSRTGYTFAGWNTSPNGGGTSYSNGALIPKDSSFTNNTLDLYAQWTYSTGRYIYGKFGSCNWGIDGAIYMSEVNNQYEVTNVHLYFGDKIKCTYYNGSSTGNSDFGYSLVVASCGGLFCFTNDGDDNLVCYAEGYYNFYAKDSGFGDGKKLSVEINGSARTAEQLAAKLMSYGPANPGVAGDGSCEEKFPAIKSMYLNNLSLIEGEQAKFRGYVDSEEDQFKNAYDRYIAWAAALGEKPWESGKISGAIGIMNNIPEESTFATTTATVVVSIIAISTAAGFLFLKKKKTF